MHFQPPPLPNGHALALWQLSFKSPAPPCSGGAKLLTLQQLQRLFEYTLMSPCTCAMPDVALKGSMVTASNISASGVNKIETFLNSRLP